MISFNDIPIMGNIIATMDGRVVWTNHESGDVDPLFSLSTVKNIYVVDNEFVVELNSEPCWEVKDIRVKDIAELLNHFGVRVVEEEGSTPLFADYHFGRCPHEYLDRVVKWFKIDPEKDEVVFVVEKGA